MDITAAADLRAPAGAVLEAVADLGTYPRWLRIVLGSVADADGAWWVDIGTKIGPFSRGKRLRMERTHFDDEGVRFERRELDGRNHSPWVLTAAVASRDKGSRLDVNLHYGGSKFLPLLDRILADEIGRAPARLDAVLARS